MAQIWLLTVEPTTLQLGESGSRVKKLFKNLSLIGERQHLTQEVVWVIKENQAKQILKEVIDEIIY